MGVTGTELEVAAPQLEVAGRQLEEAEPKLEVTDGDVATLACMTATCVAPYLRHTTNLTRAVTSKSTLHLKKTQGDVAK